MPSQITIRFADQLDPGLYARVFHQVCGGMAFVDCTGHLVTVQADGTASPQELAAGLDALIEAAIASNPYGW
jgi:hypothetical protein